MMNEKDSKIKDAFTVLVIIIVLLIVYGVLKLLL